MAQIFIPELSKNCNNSLSFTYPYTEKLLRDLILAEKQIGEEFTSLFKKEVYPTDHILLNYGQKATKLWFLVEGKAIIYRQYEGNDVVCSFFYPNDFITCYPSFHLNMPSDYYIRTEDRAVVYEIFWKDLVKLTEKYPKLFCIERVLISAYLHNITKMFFNMQTLNKTELMRFILKMMPSLFYWYSGKLIQYYLGLTAKTENRARKLS